MDTYSIWAKSKNNSIDKAKDIINEISQKEESTPFNPHVTLVTNMYSHEKAEKVFEKINKNKIIANFDSGKLLTTFRYSSRAPSKFLLKAIYVSPIIYCPSAASVD